jgi:hypothetical protein
MTRERSFKHFYPIPHNGGFIEPIIHIEYEAHDWDQESTGDIDVIDATLADFKFVKDNDGFDFIKAVMTDTDREVAQAWLDQTPLDFFHDAAFANECDIYNEPTLFLQP